MVRKLPLVETINKLVKSHQVRTNYVKWVEHYSKQTPKISLDETLRQSFTKSRLSRTTPNQKPRVYYVGTDESQDKTGFLQALADYGDLEFFRRSDGGYGQYPEMPGITRFRAQTTKDLLNHLRKLASSGWIPDILMMQAWGYSFESTCLSHIRQTYRPFIVNIGMDERLIYSHGPIAKLDNDGLLGVGRQCDLVLVTSPECARWYQCEGIPSFYFPLASNVEIYHPLNIPKIYDVGFIGNCYGIRKDLVEFLLGQGIKVQAHGTGWKAGRLSYRENNHFFNQCRIVLGIGTVGHCKELFTLKLRDFDAPLSGACYVTHANPDLNSLFSVGKDLFVCRDFAEFAATIRRLLKEPDLCYLTGQAAHQKTRRFHTYERRFADFDSLVSDLRKPSTPLKEEYFWKPGY